MGYNKEDYKKVKSEYETKYLRARALADERRRELHEKFPDVWQIDKTLGGTGKDIMKVITSNGGNTEQKIEEIKERNQKLVERRNDILRSGGYPADYSDIKYECEKCDDSGYVDGKMCSCMKKALVLAGYESSGIGGLMKTQSFDNFSLEYYKEGGKPEYMKQFFGALRRFAENFDKDTYQNFLLYGPTGLGKTHLSTAVAKTVIDRGFDVLYVTSVGMLRDFEQKRFGNGDGQGKDTDRYYTADLLIIDDLGTEIVNQFTLSCLYDIINSRINNRRSTFINTNLLQKEIEAKYNDRITSRLFGEYYPIPFLGVDIRRQKRMK